MATNLSDSERTRLESALAAICARAGIDPFGAELMRYTMNAVYRIAPAGVVVRMTTGPHATSLSTRLARVATALADHGLPITRLAPNVNQPIHAGAWSATVWTLLPQPPGHRFTPPDLAGPLQAIHAVREPSFELPVWDVLETIRERIQQAQALRDDDRDYLRNWADRLVGISLEEILHRLDQQCDELATASSRVKWTLPWSIVHGDAHAGNLLRGLGGRVVLGDLDSVSFGPPEWDLIPAAHGALRFGDDPLHAKKLADTYGLDVTTCPAWDMLWRTRDLQLLTSVIMRLRGRPDVASELAHRVRTSLTGAQDAIWHRYR